MEYNYLIALFVNLIASFAIAFFIGSKRRIGFWYSFIFCTTFSPIVGFFITIFSPSLKSRDAYKNLEGKYFTWAIVSFAFAGMAAIIAIYTGYLYFESPDFYTTDNIWLYTFLSIGLFALGLYLKNPPEHLMPINVELQSEREIMLIPKKEKIIIPKNQFKIGINWRFKLPYKLIGIIVFVLLFIGWLLKPGFGRFKEFADDIHGKKQKISCRKTGEYFIYAFYEKVVYNEYGTFTEIVSKEKYVGYLLNFHKIR